MDDRSAPRIFISYRRTDAAHVAGRLADRLLDRDHKENVFLDVQSILPGRDFAEAVDEAIGTCDVLLALISPKWVDITDKRGWSSCRPHPCRSRPAPPPSLPS